MSSLHSIEVRPFAKALNIDKCEKNVKLAI